MDDTGSMEQEHAYGSSSASLSDMQKENEARKCQTTCIREDCATRDAGVGQKMNKHVLGENERLKSPEALITENQKRTENRMGQTEEAIRLTQQMQQRTEKMFQQFLARAQEETGGKWRMATSSTN